MEPSFHGHRRIALVAAFALGLLLPGLARSQEAGQDSVAFVPRDRPVLEVRSAPGEIDIDGSLDDPGWARAAKATGFSELFPVEGAKPPVETEVWVTYDDDHLYLGFLAYDDPSTVRTSIRDRDEMFQDDFVGIMLDTYGDASWAYEIFANPSGVQGDLRIVGTGGEDSGFDIVYHSEGRITDQGYQVEMAIPFQSLRFPGREEQVWRATFMRTRPRGSREQYTWAAVSRDEQCLLCQFGSIRGIRGVEPGGALELLPAVVANHSAELADREDPDAGLADGDLDAEASVTARYAHPSGVTLEGTVNPDFSQIESDVAQIDVNTTFALFFPERRPFFQEGSDLFESSINLVYTRRINDPQVAAKAIVRRGRSAFAYLGARDATSPLLLPFQERSFVGQAEESVSTILRARRSYGEGSFVGALLTDRRFEDGGGSGTTFGVDGVHRFLDKYRFEYQLAGSRTAEPDEPGATAALGDLSFDDGEHTAVFDGETFSGRASHTSLERSSRLWSFDFDYRTSSPTFRTDNGFESRNDFRRASMVQWLTLWTEGSKWTDYISPAVFTTHRWTHDGDRRSDLYAGWVDFQFKRQTFAYVRFNHEGETFRGVEFDGLQSWEFFVNSGFSEAVRAGLYVRAGESIFRGEAAPVRGEGVDYELFGTIKPIDRLTIEPSLVWSSLHDPETDEEFFGGYILRARTNFNFSRRLFFRLVLQYNDFADRLDVEPLVTYRINPFTLFYVGSTQVWEDFDEHDVFAESRRQLFLKFQYLFQP